MRALLLSFLILLSSAGQGQPHPEGTSEGSSKPLILTQKRYSALDGLSSNCVYHIAQDANGFIWLATSKGLDRFDGRRFESHLFADMVQPEQRVAQLIIDFSAPTDSLFLLTLAQNWAFQDNDTLIGFLPLEPNRKALPEIQNPIRKARMDMDGRVVEFRLLSNQPDTMVLFQGDQPVTRPFDHVPARPWHVWHNPSEAPSLAYRTHEGLTDLLYLEGDSSHQFQSTEFLNVPPAQGESRPFIQRFDSTGLWFFTMKNRTFPKGTLVCQSPDGTLNHMGHWEEWFGFPCPALQHRMFFSTNPWNGNMWCFHDDRLTVVDQQGHLLYKGVVSENPQFGSLINAVHFADARQVWVGSCKGLDLIQTETMQFSSVFSVAGAEDPVDESGPTIGLTGCRGIVELGVDSFVFVTNGSGIRLHVGSEDRFLVDERGRGAGLHFENDSLFMGSIEGLHLLEEDGNLSPILDTELPTTIWDLHRLGPHEWLLGGETVWLVDAESKDISEYGTHTDGPLGNVYQIEDIHDTLWVTSSTGIHGLLEGMQWKRWHEIQSGAPEVMEAHHRLIDSHGEHWIGTASRGLLHWNPETRTTTVWGIDMGLPSTTIYGGVEDKEGLLWFSSDNGLFSLERETGDVKLYGRGDGLHETEFNRTGLHSGPSGTVYFSTINGIVQFDPARFSSHATGSAPLIITSLLQHKANLGTVVDVTRPFNESGELAMEPDDDFIAIKFALLDYSGVPQRFRYRTITGSESTSEWFPIDEPEINISGLPSGSTTIEIQHRLRGTTWMEPGLTIPIQVFRPWYQDPVRLISIITAFGLLIWLIVFIRLRNLRKNTQLLENMVAERTQNLQEALELQETYLKEVHHRVKNNLQIISSLLDLQAARETSTATRSALNAGRSRIESISLVHQHLYLDSHSRRISLHDFISEYVQRVEQAFLEEDNKVQWKLSGDAIMLNIEQAQPFGLLLNELLTNSLQHAHPESGELEVVIGWRETAPGTLTLSYADNGHGLPDDLLPEESSSLGMRLILRLTKQLKGRIEWKNEDRSHWNIALECPFENENR